MSPLTELMQKDLEGVSQDEAECVLEIDPIDEETESTSTARRGRATVRSSQPIVACQTTQKYQILN